MKPTDAMNLPGYETALTGGVYYPQAEAGCVRIEGPDQIDFLQRQTSNDLSLLATQLRVPIVPVHIDGTHEILPKGARAPSHRTRRHVLVRFGEPLTFGPDESVPEATERVTRAIVALGPPSDGTP